MFLVALAWSHYGAVSTSPRGRSIPMHFWITGQEQACTVSRIRGRKNQTCQLQPQTQRASNWLSPCSTLQYIAVASVATILTLLIHAVALLVVVCVSCTTDHTPAQSQARVPDAEAQSTQGAYFRNVEKGARKSGQSGEVTEPRLVSCLAAPQVDSA